MARHPTPTKIHQLRGSDKKNPQRFRGRENEPQPQGGIGPAPDHLSEPEQKIWDEVVDLMPPGVLGDTDRLALEQMVRLVYESRYGEEFNAAKGTQLMGYFGRFGMTPSDRAKISVPKGDKKDPWEEL